MAYAEPWLAGVQFAAALRKRGVSVRRCVLPPQTVLQKARLVAESIAFDRTEPTLQEEGARIHVKHPQALLHGVVDVQMTERVRRGLMNTDAWWDANALHPVPASIDQRVLYDKGLLHSWAEEHGVPVAHHWPAGTLPDRWPVIAKPAVGYGGMGVQTCHDPSQLERAGLGVPMVAEEFLTGTQTNVGGVARSGSIVVALAYRPRPGRDDANGPPVAIETVDSPEAHRIAAAVVAHLQYTGPFCLDLMQDGDGRLVMVDLNSRIFGAWSGLQRAGADILGAYLHSLDLAAAPAAEHVPAGQFFDVHVDPAVGAGRSVRGLAKDMRSVTGYRGLLGQAAPVLAKLMHG